MLAHLSTHILDPCANDKLTEMYITLYCNISVICKIMYKFVFFVILFHSYLGMHLFLCVCENLYIFVIILEGMNGVNFWDFDMFIYLKWDMGLGKY